MDQLSVGTEEESPQLPKSWLTAPLWSPDRADDLQTVPILGLPVRCLNFAPRNQKEEGSLSLQVLRVPVLSEGS